MYENLTSCGREGIFCYGEKALQDNAFISLFFIIVVFTAIILFINYVRNENRIKEKKEQ